MKIQELQTRVYKCFQNGWVATTTRTENGQTFDISTSKNYSGTIVTTAYKVEKSASASGFVSTCFGMNDRFFSMSHAKVRATQKTIQEAHFKGLAAFDEKIKSTPQKEIKPTASEIGDVLFLDGYGKTKGSQDNNWIVYDIRETNFGTNFLCIEKDTLELSVKSHVRPYSQKFGIGTYYEKGFDMASFNIDDDKLSNMLIEAQEVARIKAVKAAKEQEEANHKAAEKIAYLSQFVRADRRKTTNIIKKYCVENFNISKIEVSTEVFSGGDSMTVRYYSPKRINELELFIKSFQEGHFNGMEDIYEYDSDKQEIIISGHILETYKYVSVCHKEGAEKAEKTQIYADSGEIIQKEGVTAEVSHNIEKNGIEIKFPAKPDEQILENIKRLGFRWSRFNKVWWARYSEELLESVKSLN